MPLHVLGVQRPPPAIRRLHLGRRSPRGYGPAGRRGREVVWRNVAITSPWYPGKSSGRPPAHPRSSRRTARCDPTPLCTATSWASSSRSSPVSPHHTDNALGAENVASKPATARFSSPLRLTRSTQLTTQPHPRHRVTARQQQLQVGDRHRAGQAEACGLLTRPHAGLLTWRLGQVLGEVLRCRRRRRRVDRPQPQHRPAPHPAPPCTCLLDLMRPVVVDGCGDTVASQSVSENESCSTVDDRERWPLRRGDLVVRIGNSGVVATARSSSAGTVSA